MNPDRLASLEEEQRFLLRSLADLEREREAGDVDEHDYRALKDGYTVRAAATLRAIEEGRSALPDRSPVNWARRLVWLVGVAGLIAIVWWVLAVSSAERLPGQQITGLDPRDEQHTLLAQARALQSSQPAAAVAVYDLVLADDPTNAEALTYRGWMLRLDGVSQPDAGVFAAQLTDGLESLLIAADLEPTYADPQCFLGIILFRDLGQAEDAMDRLDKCLELNPPADVRGLVESLRSEVVDALDAGAE